MGLGFLRYRRTDSANGLRWAAGTSALLLGACTAHSDADTWFPLSPGGKQTYVVRIELGDEVRTETWVQQNTRLDLWANERVTVRTHSEGVEFYLRQARDGSIERIAHRTLVDAAPIADETPRTVLKAPFVVGTEWKTLSVPYVLRRKNEYPHELKNTHTVWLDWKIEATDDTVALSHATLRPCLRVVGRGEIPLYTDPVTGFNRVPIVSTEWYCKGYGLVKWSRKETVKSGFFTGGEISAQRVR